MQQHGAAAEASPCGMGQELKHLSVDLRLARSPNHRSSLIPYSHGGGQRSTAIPILGFDPWVPFLWFGVITPARLQLHSSRGAGRPVRHAPGTRDDRSARVDEASSAHLVCSCSSSPPFRQPSTAVSGLMQQLAASFSCSCWSRRTCEAGCVGARRSRASSDCSTGDGGDRHLRTGGQTGTLWDHHSQSRMHPRPRAQHAGTQKQLGGQLELHTGEAHRRAQPASACAAHGHSLLLVAGVREARQARVHLRERAGAPARVHDVEGRGTPPVAAVRDAAHEHARPGAGRQPAEHLLVQLLCVGGVSGGEGGRV